MTDIQKREGFRLVTEAPFPIVAMATLGSRLFVGTAHQVFELIDGIFHPMVFAVLGEDGVQK